jgi:hypothetical protein
MTLDSLPRQALNVVSRQIDDEAVLVHPLQGKVRVLNTVGARVWELADGQRTVAEIAQIITAEYDVELPRAQADVLAFCDDLAQAGVLMSEQ